MSNKRSFSMGPVRPFDYDRFAASDTIHVRMRKLLKGGHHGYNHCYNT
jgi:hypothetical protein